MWEINKRALWIVLVVLFVLGLGLVAAGVTAPEGATTDDGTPLRSVYFGVAYEVEHRAVISLMSLAALQPGTTLDIKVSPRNPNKIQLPSA